MGQKANPTSLRLGVNRTWDSRWYADDNYAGYLHEDVKIKKETGSGRHQQNRHRTSCEKGQSHHSLGKTRCRYR